MNKEVPLKKIKMFWFLGTVVLISLFLCTISAAVVEIWGKVVLLIIGILLLLLGIMADQLYQIQINSFTDAVNISLDNMIRGEEGLTFDAEQETLLGKLQLKLQRLYEIQKYCIEESLEDKKMIQSLVADISHQVKTPIANVEMYNTILQSRQMDPEKQQEFLKSMEEQIVKLDFLMKEMMEMSRLETGIIEMQPQSDFIYNTIAQALNGIYLKAENKNLMVSIECEEKLRVKHDAKWTGEALLNILDNAVKYTKSYGKIDIKVSRWECYTKIDIIDNGKGILEEYYGKIFERFFREPEVHKEEGLGLGLYLARKIVTKQGGYIEVRSSVERGSTFSVFLLNG